MTDYRDGKIHGWNGGECPVHPKDAVTVWSREGRGSSKDIAARYRWDHHGLGLDIIAFCVTKKHEEPLTLWVNVYGGGFDAYTTPEDARRSATSSAIRIAVPFQEVKE